MSRLGDGAHVVAGGRGGGCPGAEGAERRLAVPDKRLGTVACVPHGLIGTDRIGVREGRGGEGEGSMVSVVP